MNKEDYRVHINEDWEKQKLQVYIYKDEPTRRTFYQYANNVNTDGFTAIGPPNLIEHSFERNGEVAHRDRPIPTFIEMELRIGKFFLSLINDEILKVGINTRKVDMMAGKTELIESQLTFAQQQLNKLIDHLTK